MHTFEFKEENVLNYHQFRLFLYGYTSSSCKIVIIFEFTAYIENPTAFRKWKRSLDVPYSPHTRLRTIHIKKLVWK